MRIGAQSMKQVTLPASAGPDVNTEWQRVVRRRSFLSGLSLAGAAVPAGALLAGQAKAAGRLTKGDAAILRFLAAAEIIETDLWIQYSELGGTQDKEVSGSGGANTVYTAALQVLDGDMPQYIHD